MTEKGYQGLFGDDEESLVIFLRCLQSFERQLRLILTAGSDFTMRFEVRGNNGRMLHCRVNSDSFDRPRSRISSESKKGG